MSNRSNNDPNDFFQEFVGRLFDELGCRIEEQPAVGSRKSDYLATTLGGESFYIEATAVRPEQFSKPRPAEDDVCRKLDEICQTPYLYSFWATASGELYQHIAKKDLDSIKGWMEGLSTEGLSPQSAVFSFPSGKSPHDAQALSEEWKIEIVASPRPEERRGIPAPLLVGFGRGGGIDSVSPLVRAARAKVKQHKHVSGPLLLAMNDLADFPSDRSDISVALFGWEQSAETGMSRITPPKGYSKLRSIWGRQENTTISAILLFHGLLPHSIQYAEVCLYENPWARHPVPTWLRGSFPHAEIEREGDVMYLRWPAEEGLSKVLGISSESKPYADLERQLNESIRGIFRQSRV